MKKFIKNNYKRFLEISFALAMVITVSSHALIYQALAIQWQKIFQESRQWQIASDAPQTLAPTGQVTWTNLSNSYLVVDDDPDSPAGDWATAVTNATDTLAHVSFNTPTGDLTTGAGLQEFRIYVRNNNATKATSQVRVDLYENNVFKIAVVTTQNVTSGTGQLFFGTWDASELTNVDGSGVECYVYGTWADGAGPNDAETEVDAIEWNATYTPPANTAPTVSGVNLGTVPSGADGLINLTESIDTQIVVSASVDDTTCAELSGVKAYVFVSSSSWEYIGDGTTCSFDWNDCYTPEQISSCDQTSCTGGAAVYTCEADHGNGMWYHASPTGSGASYSTEFWYAMMIASDSYGADGWATSSVGGVDVQLLQAFTVSSSLAYPATLPGSDSSIVSTVTVENTGNRGINFTINAADEAGAGLELSGGGYNIATQAQQFSTVSFTVSDGNAVSLSETAFEVDEGGLPKPQTHVAGDNDDQLFWGIAVPADAQAGDYTGTATYTSTSD